MSVSIETVGQSWPKFLNQIQRQEARPKPIGGAETLHAGSSPTLFAEPRCNHRSVEYTNDINAFARSNGSAAALLEEERVLVT